MRAMIFLCLVAIAPSALAQAEHNEATSQSKSSDSKQRGTRTNPIVVDVLPPADADQRAREEKEERVAKRKSDEELNSFTGKIAEYNRDLARYTGYLIAVGVIQICIFIAQLFYIGLQESTSRTIERAYVQMSHVVNDECPGLMVDHATGKCRIVIVVKNHGATPARVTRLFLTKRVLASHLPGIPDYRPEDGEIPEQPLEAFLIKNGDIFVRFDFTVAPSDIPLIRQQKKQLAVYGFADFTDQFGRHFRCGYGRNWVPDMVPNNLVYVTQPRYNYDRKRKRGQGSEWA